MLVAIAIGVRIYFDQGNDFDVVGEKTEEPGGIFGFLGFGDSPSDTGSSAQTDTPDENTQDRPVFIPTLRQVTDEPVAGATFIGTSTIKIGRAHV